MTTSASWFQSVTAGWPNLLQGLVSAVITGLVAALVSLTVVRLTDSSLRKLALQQQARDKVVDALESGMRTFVGVPDERSLRADIEDVAVLDLRFRIAAAVVAAQDRQFSTELDRVATRLHELTERWSQDAALGTKEAALDRYNEVWQIFASCQDAMITWLRRAEPGFQG
ncbi:hypothetical protein [Actinoplanes sp. TFC3]|uniref:hypothetical protein n=1 Tax=Actinoplanes sp. TFC3 TaxID=1710355 RepID=UPI00082B796E|nr:hypothetical protein [Actinoplanes sp. TFC3]